VTESLTGFPEKPRAGTPARIAWAVLILATLCVCYFSHLGAIGFVGPDEPRYAWIARDMAETGDWVTPRLYGKPWFEKPPLFYWGAAVCFKAFGVSETAARLPSAISALLATLALAWLALRLYGAETARWLLLLLPTSVGMIGFSHAAATDMPFSGMLTIAMVCAAVVLGLTRNENSPILPRTPWLALILFGFFLGLAVLAKGPAAIILSGGAVFFWALFTRRWRDAFRLLHPAAIAAFCLTALPWYILCARRNPDFFRIFIIEHNFKRFLTPEFQHIQPFWYYGPIFLLATLPWTAVPLWSAVSRANQYYRTRELDRCALLFGMLTIFCLLFFSISKSKLPGYILPAILGLGMIFSEPIASAWASKRKSLSFSLSICAFLLFAIGMLLDRNLLHLSRSDSIDQSGIALLMFFLAVPSLVLACGLYSRLSSGIANSLLALAILWIILPLYFAAGRYLAFIDHDNSPRYLSERILSRDLGSDVRTYKINRSWAYGLDYYLHQEVPELQETSHSDSYVVTTIEGSGELAKKGFSLKLVDFGRSGNVRQSLSLYRIAASRLSGGDSR
jgi:4-amino-4-deoxy-L-arabinose transferase-like glycosyltransferase